MTSSAASPGLATLADKVRIFASYDLEHDADLAERLAEQASSAASGFEISGRSGTRTRDPRDERLRREIRQADQVIVICGQHTDDACRVSDELRIAQEEDRPYFLLWGRRERMCTRPTTARRTDVMYSWTREILRSQIRALRRTAESTPRR